MGAAYRTHVANGVADTGALTHDSDPITAVAGDVLYAYFVSSDNTPVAPTGVVWDPDGAAHVWYHKRGFATVDDLTCDAGTGRSFSWADASNKATLVAAG